MHRYSRTIAVAVASAALVFAGCGSGDATLDASTGDDLPTVAVTTNILGDVLENLVGDQVRVVTIMSVGSDPHEFQASAQQVAEIGAADAVISNGGGFEEGLLDVLEAAESDGVALFEAISSVSALEFDGDHDEHGDEEHADDEHGDEEHADDEHGDEEHSGHAHEGEDPHFFTDPSQMVLAANGIVSFLIDNVDGIDVDALNASSSTYIAQLEALDAEVEALLEAVPTERRVLVTNHEVFGYFAERYGVEVAGTIIPGGSSADGADAQALAALAELIEHEGVPAIFADTSASGELAATLADEVGEIAVVELFSESLGTEGTDGATYLDMVRTNAERIADALTG